MSTLSPSSIATPYPQREPPPSLFLGPPSRNASAISLASPSAPADPKQRAPLHRSRSNRGPEPATAPLSRPRLQPPEPSQTEGDRTDALWAEMQATLAEVELSAFSSTHVFGSAHSAALEELREAQIALAKAWGRGEHEQESDAEGLDAEKRKAKEEGKNDTIEGGEEEESDILEARRRRAANERFFSKVSNGVEDVVGKLEGVAQAMAKVERESREIWSGSDSVDSGSVVV